ncbi:MAG TPA: hypothetical protein VFL55_08325 [Acetobacteraceae bacterium]|nr:hypothetical protein [Acetobacteraceae bacterium]
MDAPPSPVPADTLPSSILLVLAHTLRQNLSAAATDSPKDAARSECAAIEHAASLLPATADEANLAALYVAASAQALECLRLSRLYPNDSAVVLKCTAQSASMMRQARAFRTALERAQIARRKREGTAAADAAKRKVPASVADAPAQAPSPEPSKLNPIAEAERYALHHRKRAVLIRRLGHLPAKFGWLAPEVVHAVATGATPILRGLDEKPARMTAVAA